MTDPTRDEIERLLRQYGAEDVADRLAENLLAVFLIVPRSDIQGHDFACRYLHRGQVFIDRAPDCVFSRKKAIEFADEVCAIEEQRGGPVTAEAVQRPILPWSPIPLSEETA